MTRALSLMLLPLSACVIITDGKEDDSATADLHACATTLPSDVRVVRGSIDAVTDNEIIWLCEGGTANLTADGVVVWSENGGTVNVNADNAEIWSVGSSNVNVSADDVVVHYEPDSNVNVVGDDVTVDACRSISIDAAAVENPC